MPWPRLEGTQLFTDSDTVPLGHIAKGEHEERRKGSRIRMMTLQVCGGVGGSNLKSNQIK